MYLYEVNQASHYVRYALSVVSQNAAKYYKIIQGTTTQWQVLPLSTKYYQVLQSQRVADSQEEAT